MTGVLSVDGSSPTVVDCPPHIVMDTAGRRRVLRGLFASAAGMALAPVLVASGATESEEARFCVTYRGRRIVGIKDDAGRLGDGASSAWHVTVDGRPLHLMRRADGSWMTMVDHYQSYPTPLAAACAAVDELGPTARLGPSRGRGGRGAEGDHRHGAHA